VAVVLVDPVSLLLPPLQQKITPLQIPEVAVVVDTLPVQAKVVAVAMGLQLSDTQEPPLGLAVLPGFQGVTPTTFLGTSLVRKR